MLQLTKEKLYKIIEDYQESITAVLIDFWDYVVCTYMKGHFNQNISCQLFKNVY
jgi:hypothetical protein